MHDEDDFVTGTIIVHNISYDLSKLSHDERHRQILFSFLLFFFGLVYT